MANPWDIVGYAYQADEYCPGCIVAELGRPDSLPPFGGLAAEDCLNQVAAVFGIDRQDESSFDGYEFPKVILREQVSSLIDCPACYGRGYDEDETCLHCLGARTFPGARCGSCGRDLAEV
jgi:hypothetical protein